MRSPFRWILGLSLLTSFALAAYVLLSAWRDFGLPADIGGKNTPGAEASSRFRFLVMGENEGVNPVFETILNEAKGRQAAFLVHVADLTPRSDPADFAKVHELLETLPFPYYTAVGNNDIVGDPERSRYRSVFSTAALGLEPSAHTYYSFTHENAHFIVLDNADRKVGFSEEELAWLQADLQSNQARWTFLFFHRPIQVPFSEFYGDDETAASRASNEAFLSIIGAYPITHIYTGHLHTLFSYSLGSIPVTITGGGGAAPHAAYGNILGTQYHYLEVEVSETEVTQMVHRLE